MKNNYRPTVEDFTPTKTQELSLREAGQFDWNRLPVEVRVAREKARLAKEQK